GFSMIPTERPFMLVFKNEEINFFVPELEKLHVQEEVPNAAVVETYFEYPDLIHPLKHFSHFIKKTLGIKGKIGAEYGGAPGIWGYQGPKFEEVLSIPVKIHSDIITDLRIIKDDYELACIRESAKWGGLAHKLLQEYTQIGENEIDVSFKASHEASKQMRKELGPKYSPVGYGSSPCGASYRGQIGPYSAIPHAMTRNTVFQKGDTLVTGASANIAGYLSELERTMFMGEPSKKQRGYYGIMMKSQQAAFDAFKPGIPVSEVDRAARKVFKEAGVMNLVQHHTGHSIGLEGHERPFLDIGANVIMKPRMVFTVEPGIYDRSIGGFRHSDTIIITEDGMERITMYPRELEDLIIE
ncbi:MAG: aminopeptidase P family protein, partial [Candidatus Heimdallarchaeota archaeon]|nr:aminopeptidase P family protein [Candidatus Heimdallarchaeota archaeon]